VEQRLGEQSQQQDGGGSVSFSNQQPVNPDSFPSVVVSANQETRPFLFGKLKLLIILTLSFILAGVGFVYLFINAVGAEAKYLEATAFNLNMVREKASYYEAAFIDLTHSYESSKEAFYEMTSLRKYFDALEDTRQDIEDIEETLNLVNKSIKDKDEIVIPEEVAVLNSRIDRYYKLIYESLSILLKHQYLQMKMLQASGGDLNVEIQRLDKIFAKEISFEELEDCLEKVSVLADVSVEKFKKIEDIPESEASYYNRMLDYHQDLASTSKLLLKNLKQNTAESAYGFMENSIAFSSRNLERDEIGRKETESWMNESGIREKFEEASLVEEKIIAEYNLLAEKYGLKIRLEEVVD
jgi:hypothetical protein